MSKRRKTKADKRATRKTQPETTITPEPVVASPLKENTMSLSTTQAGLIGTISMQAMAFGLQVGNEGSDTAHMQAIKRDLTRAQTHRSKTGIKCYEALAHHVDALGSHLALVERDLNDTPTSRQRPLLERKTMLSLMHQKLQVALDGFEDFAPAPVIEDTAPFEENAQQETPKPDTASEEESPAEGAQEEEDDTTD